MRVLDVKSCESMSISYKFTERYASADTKKSGSRRMDGSRWFKSFEANQFERLLFYDRRFPDADPVLDGFVFRGADAFDFHDFLDRGKRMSLAILLTFPAMTGPMPGSVVNSSTVAALMLMVSCARHGAAQKKPTRARK